MTSHGHHVVVGQPQHSIARCNNRQAASCCENQMAMIPLTSINISDDFFTILWTVLLTNQSCEPRVEPAKIRL